MDKILLKIIPNKNNMGSKQSTCKPTEIHTHTTETKYVHGPVRVIREEIPVPVPVPVVRYNSVVSDNTYIDRNDRADRAERAERAERADRLCTFNTTLLKM